MKTPVASQADTEAVVTNVGFLVKAGGQSSPSSPKGWLHPFSASKQHTVLRSLRLAKKAVDRRMKQISGSVSTCGESSGQEVYAIT